MTLKEPSEPSVNHNFRTPTESGGNIGRKQANGQRYKDKTA